MKVSEIMTRPVFHVSPGDTLSRLAEQFNRLGISGAPVLDAEGRLQGVVSKTDLVREEWGSRELLDAEPRTVKDIMTPVVITVQEDDPVEKAAALMSANRIHRVVVLKDGKVTGMLSSFDLVKVMGKNGSAGQ